MKLLQTPQRKLRLVRSLVPALATLLLAGASVGVSAQSSSSTRSNDSWLPGTTDGYIGLNVGKPEYGSSCGTGLYGCSDPDARVHLFSGGMLNSWFGLEVGYLYEGSADRGGGRQRAEGVNLSAVLKAPLGMFNVYAKAGALYGRTRVTSAPLSGIVAGEERGWGSALALGVGYDFTRQSGVVLEATRNEFRFPGGGGRRNIDGLSLGYVHRF